MILNEINDEKFMILGLIKMISDVPEYDGVFNYNNLGLEKSFCYEIK